MIIRYTRHARQRMAQRRISEEEVVDVLVSPDEISEGGRGEMIASRRYLNREVRVVYEEIEEDTALIFTVIRTRIRR